MAAKSKVKLNYELPDEVVEDYTYEMGRLKFKVIKNKYLYKSICFIEAGPNQAGGSHIFNLRTVFGRVYFEIGTLYLRLSLSSTLIRHESGAFWKL